MKKNLRLKAQTIRVLTPALAAIRGGLDAGADVVTRKTVTCGPACFPTDECVTQEWCQ